jgi:ribosomal protein S18 acetylase RimI-like enzyme
LHLKHVELSPEYQRRGVGTALIRDLSAQARALGLPLTLHVLNVNPARRLYERLGLRVVAEVDTGPHGRKYFMSTTAVEPIGKE